MKAIAIDGFGGPDMLQLLELPEPKPEPDEVLIKLAYASVNPVDWKIVAGRLQSRFPHHFPLVPGWDAAGTIAGMGAKAAGFSLDDEVYAYCRKPVIQWGTYAEYVTVPAANVAPKPKRMSFAQAATIPLVGLTAWESLFDAAGLQSGQTVLIHAGAGGVGSMAIQFAKHAGAKVLTTAGSANHDYVRSLGADFAIDYKAGSFVDAAREIAPDGVDVVFDTVGGETQAESYKALRKGGVLVSITAPPGAAEVERHGVRGAYVFVSPNGQHLRRIAELIDAGHIRAPEIQEMPLSRAADAHRLSQEGHVRGKIALRIG